MKSMAVLLNLLDYFYHRIQHAKTRNSVQGKAFKVQHEIYRFKTWTLIIKTKSVMNDPFASNFGNLSQSYVFDDSVKFCKFLGWY